MKRSVRGARWCGFTRLCIYVAVGRALFYERRAIVFANRSRYSSRLPPSPHYPHPSRTASYHATEHARYENIKATTLQSLHSAKTIQWEIFADSAEEALIIPTRESMYNPRINAVVNTCACALYKGKSERYFPIELRLVVNVINYNRKQLNI